MGPEWQIFIPVWNIFYMMLEKARWDSEDYQRDRKLRKQRPQQSMRHDSRDVAA